eukprot:bmy_16606T0
MTNTGDGELGQVSTDASSLRKADPKGRSALLADIQQGTRLRKVTQINDRSAPQIDSSKGTNKEGGGPANSRGGSTPPALGDLFAGGFPVLRPAGQRDAAGTSGGKLNPPPAPPARSPTTELSSRSQQAPAWTPTQQPGGQLRNGILHIIDDFESKFTFHSMEDFPPPDEYKPCQKIYPSKIPRIIPKDTLVRRQMKPTSCEPPGGPYGGVDIPRRTSDLTILKL